MHSTSTDFEDSVGISPWTVLPRGTYRSPHGTTQHCAETKLSIDVNSDMLYFLSRGPLSRGSITFRCETSEKGEKEREEATVLVRFFHSAPEILQHVRVCRLRRDDTNQGVGIHTDAYFGLSPAGFIGNLTLVVALPHREHLSVDSLVVMMPQFAIHLDKSWGHVSMRSLTLQTTNAPIIIEDIGDVGITDISTTNAKIEGKLCCAHDMHVKTSNAPIEVWLIARNDDAEHPTQGSLNTSNGTIQCQASLVSAILQDQLSAFKLTTKTSNASINMRFDTSPVHHVLNWEASSSNGSVYAILDSAYQGDFYLSSSPFNAPSVHVNESARDPTGEGRRRIVRFDQVASLRRPGTVEGTVQWGGDEEKDGARGSVEVTTSNAKITLVV